MSDLKRLLEPLSDEEMPDRWGEIGRRSPRPLPPEPRRSRIAAYAVGIAALVAVVALIAYLAPLASDDHGEPGDSGEPPAWLVERAYQMAYASGDITPTSAGWVLSDADTIAPAVGLEHGDPTIQEYLVVLVGDFTAYSAKVPPGADLPTGSVLSFAISAGTREVTDLGVGVSNQDVQVPGLQPFALPDPSHRYTDGTGGWSVVVPPGWTATPFTLDRSGTEVSGSTIANREMPPPQAAGQILPQVSGEGFPDDGVAFVVAPSSSPWWDAPIRNTPLSIDDFNVGSSAGGSTLDTLWFTGNDTLFGATLRLGPDVSPVDRDAIASVVSSLSFETSPSARPADDTGPSGVSPDAEPTPAGIRARDVPLDLPGVGPVCGATAVEGNFLGDAPTRAYVYEPQPQGGCDGPNEEFQYLGIAEASGEVVAVSDRLTSCLSGEGCWAFAAPDVDADGRDEVAVAEGHEDGVVAFQLFRVVECGPAADCVRERWLEPLETGLDFGPSPGSLTVFWGATPTRVSGMECWTRMDPNTGDILDGPVMALVDGTPSADGGWTITDTALRFDGSTLRVADRSRSESSIDISGRYTDSLCGASTAVERPPSLTHP